MRKYIVTLAIVAVFVGSSLLVRYSQKSKNIVVSTTHTVASSGSNTNTSSPSQSTKTTDYLDGNYSGSVENAFYGNVQVSVVIRGGKITSVNFLSYPSDNQTSIGINQQAIPTLQSEAIKAQSSHVDTVSGATFTSQAFVQSLASALAKA